MHACILDAFQGSRLRLKRSHLRPKIFICEWCFCWGRHWRLYKFTCYDLKICMQLFCDHSFCYVSILNLKLKDDAHQSFSGKKFKQSSSLQHSSADAHSLLNAAPVVQHERDWNDGDVQVQVQKSTAVKPAATPKCMVNLAATLFCCVRIYSALRRSSAGLSPAFTKPIFFFFIFFLLLNLYIQTRTGK